MKKFFRRSWGHFEGGKLRGGAPIKNLKVKEKIQIKILEIEKNKLKDILWSLVISIWAIFNPLAEEFVRNYFLIHLKIPKASD